MPSEADPPRRASQSAAPSEANPGPLAEPSEPGRARRALLRSGMSAPRARTGGAGAKRSQSPGAERSQSPAPSEANPRRRANPGVRLGSPRCISVRDGAGMSDLELPASELPKGTRYHRIWAPRRSPNPRPGANVKPSPVRAVADRVAEPVATRPVGAGTALADAPRGRSLRGWRAPGSLEQARHRALISRGRSPDPAPRRRTSRGRSRRNSSPGRACSAGRPSP